MNDEQAVLDFFSRKENLPLALIAAAHLDDLRQQLNNQFWQSAQQQIQTALTQSTHSWQCVLTEDRNKEGNLVGLYLQPATALNTFLRPFMEQQANGREVRVFFGLMWSQPNPVLAATSEVASLQDDLEKAGFRHSETFPAWQWLPVYPRRHDFLLRYSNTPDDVVREAVAPLLGLMENFGARLQQVNMALNTGTPSKIIPLQTVPAA